MLQAAESIDCQWYSTEFRYKTREFGLQMFLKDIEGK